MEPASCFSLLLESDNGAVGSPIGGVLSNNKPERPKEPEFDTFSGLKAARALELVLESRTHKKKYLGQIYTLPGQLAKALRVPNIISKLESKASTRRQRGLEEFLEVWSTLSIATKSRVLDEIGWYEPEQLDWEDKRSNKMPKIEVDIDLEDSK